MEITARRFPVWIFALACLSSTLPVYSAPAADEDYVCGQYVAATPRARLETAAEAALEAHQLARALPGAVVLRGVGDSMLPLYRSGTLLVVQHQPYDRLARGMTVVFHASDRSIAHVLVARTADGWRTTGLHNRRPDYLQVNDANIVGVVVAAFTPIEGVSVAMR